MTLLRPTPATSTITNVKVKTITDELLDVLIHRSKEKKKKKKKKKEKEHHDDDDENDYDENKTKTTSQNQEQQQDQNYFDVGFTVVDWDDGHIQSGCNNQQSKMVIHDKQSQLQLQSKSQQQQQQHLCAVIDNAISTKTADAICKNAIGVEERDKKDITTTSVGENEHDKVWGEYIKLEDIDAIIKDYEESRK